MMSAVQHRYRRFEMRFRETPSDSSALPAAPGSELGEAEDEPCHHEEAIVDDRAAELGKQGRFVRQPVKVRLVPRWRPVR